MSAKEQCDESSKVQLSRVGSLIVVSAAARPLPNCLSACEREVVEAVLAGDSNQDIARQRGTSVKTVANQLYRVYRKLRVNSRAELAARCAAE